VTFSPMASFAIVGIASKRAKVRCHERDRVIATAHFGTRTFKGHSSLPPSIDAS